MKSEKRKNTTISLPEDVHSTLWMESKFIHKSMRKIMAEVLTKYVIKQRPRIKELVDANLAITAE